MLVPARKEIAWEVRSNGCHDCTSHPVNSNGYPQCKRLGKNHKVHRLIYIEHHGEIPDGLVIRHKCDNRKCINIEHLEIGTIADNNHDTIVRGRHRYGVHENQKGEENFNSLLTEDVVRAIRSDTTTPNTHLARKYGVHHATISLVRLCKTWRHVV